MGQMLHFDGIPLPVECCHAGEAMLSHRIAFCMSMLTVELLTILMFQNLLCHAVD